MFIPLLTLARPYSQAIFDFACKNQVLDKWELMLIRTKKIIEDPTIIKLISNINIIKSDELSDLIILIGKHDFDIFGQNFIRTIVKYKKLALVPIILERYLILKRRWEMTLQVRIITADLLNNIQKMEIDSVLKKKFLCTIDIVYNLDSSIIGGMLIYINDYVIDGSIQGCFKRLKDILEVTGRKKYAIKCN